MIPPRSRTPKPTIAVLYGAIVAQARDPRFYEAYRVPNTVLGRFDLIVLHLALVLRRLHPDAATRILAQDVFDAFCRSMEHNLREMGISDPGVPRQMQKVARRSMAARRPTMRPLPRLPPLGSLPMCGRR